MLKQSNNSLVIQGRIVGGSPYYAKGVKKTQEGKDIQEYVLQVIIDKDTVERVEKLMADVQAEVWPHGAVGLNSYGVYFGDNQDYEYTYQKYYIRPRAYGSQTTLVWHPVRKKYLPALPDDNLFYPGAYVYVLISVFCFEPGSRQSFKPGMTLQWSSVCFWKHGERLYGIDPTIAFLDAGVVSEGLEGDFLSSLNDRGSSHTQVNKMGLPALMPGSSQAEGGSLAEFDDEIPF